MRHAGWAGRQEWKSFFCFIDGGSEAELQQRKDALDGVLQKVTDPGVRCDTRRLLRLVGEEVLNRQNLSLPEPARRPKRA
jgi:poly-gamma-glutamate capsule biosynthesis protein CapA/YwtB (metallophosphatase superfamily)